MYTYICAHIRVCTCVLMLMHMGDMYRCVHTCVYICACVCVSIYVWMCRCERRRKREN